MSGKQQSDPDALFSELHTPELSWRVWRIMQSTGWEHLPLAGGVLDQPDTLMADLATISARHRHIKDLVDAGSTISVPGGHRKDRRDNS